MDDTDPTDEAGNALARFQTLLRIPTMSRAVREDTDWAQFERFRTAIRDLYPLTHAALERQRIGDGGILMRWAGTQPGAPIVLMGHYDVVVATDEGWTYPPFAATIAERSGRQVLWGRGAIDNKGQVVAILEAVEAELRAGHRPQHDVYLAFGGDEETVGSDATAIVELFVSQRIRPALVLDEGGAVVDAPIPGVSGTVAMIGVAEKGVLTVRLRADEDGGHASTPAPMSAPARITRALERIRRRPFRARLDLVGVQMLQALGTLGTDPRARLLRNAHRLRGVLTRVLLRGSNETRAMVRTTSAITRLQAGLAENAIPEHAEASVNLRLAVGTSVADALRHLRRVVDDPAVTITAGDQASDPTAVSRTSGTGWDALISTIREQFPDAVPVPYTTVQATDARWWSGRCDAVYRFAPFTLTAAERATLHTVDERIDVASWLHGITVYRALIRKL
jgi:carboxypeptidase PM20D1